MKCVITSLLLLLLGFSCSDENNTNKDNTNSSSDFSSYIDSKNLRIFAKSGVSESFLNNVGTSYELMFSDGENIDPMMRSHYLTTTKDKYAYQRVGVFSENDPNFDPGTPPKPYDHNVTDYIWELEDEPEEQLGEVVEHLLHTVTTVILYLAYPDEWDYNNSSSALYLAMQEAVEKGIYDISDYSDLKNDKDAYNKILTQEYAYWLILAEWNYFITARKKMDGISGNEEFIIGTPNEISSKLPLGHKLYKNYVEKIISIPDSQTMLNLFPSSK